MFEVLLRHFFIALLFIIHLYKGWCFILLFQGWTFGIAVTESNGLFGFRMCEFLPVGAQVHLEDICGFFKLRF